MIAISSSDKKNYGCPYCGCEVALLGGSYGQGTAPVTCIECNKRYVILADGVKKSSIGFGTDMVDASGETIFEYPSLSMHPRKGIPSHKYVEQDIKPETGDYCSPRGVGYDLACFVKTKIAGERITEMAEKYEDDGLSCRLDYRPSEPKWIQVKFSILPKIREYFLDGKLRENDRIITDVLLNEVVTMPINFTNVNKYKRGFSLGSFYNLKDALEDYYDVMNNNSYGRIEGLYSGTYEEPMDFHQKLGLFLVIDVLKNKDNYKNCKLLGSYLSGTKDEFSSSSNDISNGIKYLLDLYNEEFGNKIEYKDERDFEVLHNYDNSRYDDIFKDILYIENILRKIDYSDLERLFKLHDAKNEEEIETVTKDIDLNRVYPLCTLFGLLSKLTKRKKEYAQSEFVNQYNAGALLELLVHVTNVQIDDNPYQEVYDLIKEILVKYRKPVEIVKQNIIN